ncbi:MULTISPECIES: ribosomal-processing cysteine protease Prp [unclassified Butyrivibrio]|uniref:ribosomal-processing cysteine protease Prp n=1 Tax=unclassified Butyrivibrio TaxID=2639466 RepID=UPI00047B76A2|nr:MULTISPECIES: ribosomal-processing cysteine protease Prp [unclassified Butyrivibrio]
MTNIIIRKNKDGEILGFKLEGHAGSGEYGKDIVCAAISMLSINTVNSLEKFTDDNFTCDADPVKGLIDVKSSEGFSENGELLLKSFELGIMGVYKQYGNEFLNIKFEEV